MIGNCGLDSGDLATLSRKAREILDAAGLGQVGIFVSGGLEEDAVAALVAAGAPIDGFGVGTAMGVSDDAPSLDIAYKLVAYAGEGRVKLSSGKRLLPGPKQVFRREEGGIVAGDVIARADETLPGRPLLRPVMEGGRRLASVREPLKAVQVRAGEETGKLPAALRGLAPADPPYPVAISPALAAHAVEVAARTRR